MVLADLRKEYARMGLSEADVDPDPLRQFRTWWEHALAAQVPVVTGELGENDCAHNYIDQYMSWADAHGISYVGWTWDTWGCSDGPALISDYTGTPTAFGVGFRDHLAGLIGPIRLPWWQRATPRWPTRSRHLDA